MPSQQNSIAVSEKKLRQLELTANAIREDLLRMLEHAGSGHSAGPLGLADIFTALYFHILEHRPQKPMWPKRDRLFLSNGHTVPVRYATLAHAGYFDKKELATLRRFGSHLQGHPEIRFLPAVEHTSGPLGDGSSQACGTAYAAKMDNASWHTFCILSDAELQCGITWEAALFAAKYNLNNLTWIIDRNNIQIDGQTEDVMPLEPLHDKFAAFGWNVIEIDGHNMRSIIDACNQAKATTESPTVIIAHTIPGKGIDFMEKNFTWHGKPPNKEELKIALGELRTLGGKIKSE
jgi:transketolase